MTRSVFSLVLAFCAALAGCRGAAEDTPAFANLAPGVAYVGDAVCATCHEDLYASYQSHGMARSFYRWTPEVRVEAGLEAPVRHAASGFEYRIVEEADSLYQEEVLRSSTGEVVHRLRRRMDFVVGSGNAARTYFTEENGRLFQLPLTWYTQADDGRGRWDFSPGYETKNGRFGRLVPDRCMACHNSYPEPVAHAEGKYAALPEGIGCERCHGPGSLHVDARTEAPEPAGEVDSTIVNPAHLAFDLRLDVCQQCHLHTSVDVLREGETAFSYRPGQPLASHVAFFVTPDANGAPGGPGAGISVVSHADRMRRSPCFRATRDAPRPLECTTCHDPHEGFRDRGPAYFNETCLGCHAAEPLQEQMPTAELRAQHAPDANCFACHMPAVEADDAPHASFTDHFIRVVGDAEAPEPEPLEPGPSELLAPYYERDVDSGEGAVYEGMAAVVFGTQSGDQEAMAHGAALLTNTLRPGAPDADTTHGEGYFLLGVAAHRLGKLDFAVPALEHAARLDEAVPQRLDALALAYEAERRSPETIERLYRRALALQPALATVRTNYGRFLQAQERRADALAAYREARRERPSLDLAAFYEGAVLAELGRRGEADAAFADAVHLDPANAELVANLVVVGADGGVQRYRSGERGDVFGISAQPSVAPGANGRGVRFLDLPPDATVRVYTASGMPIRTLERRAGRPLTWDLRTDGGHRAEPGIYLVHVRTLAPTGQTVGTRLFRLALARRAPDAPAL